MDLGVLIPSPPRSHSRWAAFLFCIVLAAGCSSRERANPFDPNNPSTRGNPPGFMAMADDGRVELRWDAVAGADLAGFRIYRRTAAELTFRPIADLLPARSTRFTDFGLLNGLEHAYQIYFVFQEDGERGPPASDVATPGPARPWVADASRGRVYRLTPDGRHIAYVLAGLGTPTAVATDSASDLVWISDSSGGRVIVLDPATGVVVTIPGLVSPGSLAVEPRDRAAWVCDEQGQTVHTFTAAGGTIGAPLEPIQTPLGIAIARRDRSVWICERGADRVRRYSATRALMWSVPLTAPSRVAVDSASERGWITSFSTGRVYRVAPSGAIEDTIGGLRGPIGIALDTPRGRVWVADALAGEVVVYDLSGNPRFRIAGIPEARDISIDPTTGEAWVAAPGSGEVVRISPTGLVLHRLAGLGEPSGISIDPQQKILPPPVTASP